MNRYFKGLTHIIGFGDNTFYRVFNDGKSFLLSERDGKNKWFESSIRIEDMAELLDFNEITEEEFILRNL